MAKDKLSKKQKNTKKIKVAKSPVSLSGNSEENKKQVKKTFKIAFPRINLSQRQRVLAAAVFSIILLGGIIYVNIYGFSLKPFLPKPTADEIAEKRRQEFLNSPVIQEQIQILQQITDNFDPLTGIVKKIKFKDLPIYPKNWVDKQFTLTEQRNSLISGPQGDADGDGLSNKEEYLYGADPKVKNSLCLEEKSKITFGDLCALTDKQLIEKRVSPLTGLALGDQDTDILVTNSDSNFIESIQNSFEKASQEGVEFTTLYQLSKKIDLSDEYSKVKVNSVAQNRQNTLDYLEFRSNFLKGFIKDSPVTSLIDIYDASVEAKLVPILADYAKKRDSLEKAVVPAPEVESHRRLTFIFQKLYDLASYRLEAVKDKTLITDGFKEKSKKLATEVVWAFRNLDEGSVKKS